MAATTPDGLDDATVGDIMLRTRRVALVGASNKPARPSYGVMRFLLDRGYDVVPVNPGLAGQSIHGRPVVATLAEAAPLEMVDIFRAVDQIPPLVDDAIRLGAATIWMQLNLIDQASALRAREAGLAVVMDRCPAIEWPRLRLPPRLSPRRRLDAATIRTDLAPNQQTEHQVMTNEERELIERFIARVSGAQATPGGFGSVPATTQQALPPLDPDADRLIRDNFQRYPEAPYRITQMAVVQEAALAESQNRIKRLEWELTQSQSQLQTAQSQPQQKSGGFFGGLFGGGQQQQNQAPPPRWGGQPGPQQGYQGQPQGQGYAGGPPQPNYPPGYQPGMFQRQGSGFLGSALTTAAGVAGGMVAGNVLMDMFTGHGMGGGGGFGGGMGGGFGGGGETIINNNYGDAGGAAGGDPFGGAGSDVDPNFDAGGGDADFGGGDSGGFNDDSF